MIRLPPEDRAHIVKLLEDSRAEFLSYVENETPAQWTWKPAAERWSGRVSRGRSSDGASPRRALTLPGSAAICQPSEPLPTTDRGEMAFELKRASESSSSYRPLERMGIPELEELRLILRGGSVVDWPAQLLAGA